MTAPQRLYGCDRGAPPVRTTFAEHVLLAVFWLGFGVFVAVTLSALILAGWFVASAAGLVGR